MQHDEKRAAVAAYKERKIESGIYAIRCPASGEIWVGQAPNIDAVQNRIWFMARFGDVTCQSFQEAWSARGQDAFAFEILERLEEEESAYIRNARLKERVAHWRKALGAAAI